MSDETKYVEYGCTCYQKPDGSWEGSIDGSPPVQAESLTELRQKMSAQQLASTVSGLEAQPDTELVAPAPPGLWGAIRAWASANPWSISVAVVGTAGFAALALWLVFNAVFG